VTFGQVGGADDIVGRAIEAHGGDRFGARSELTVRLSAGGLAYALKGRDRRPRELRARVSTGEPRTEFADWPAPGRAGVWTPEEVRIEGDGGRVESAAEVRRSARRSLRWGDLEELFFNGYALWHYTATPWILARPGVELRELEPRRQGGEVWRRVRVRFPDAVPSHSREQTYYFGPDGLLRRLDYTAEVFGSWARAAHECFEPQETAGLVYPARRRVHPLLPGGRPLRPVTLVAIAWKGVE
jgi:hypothetical protein